MPVRLAKTNLERGAMCRLAPAEGRPRLAILNSGRTLRIPRGPHATQAVGAIGGGRAISFCQPAKVLRNRCQGELELRACGTAKSQSAKPQNALEVREQHLDLLAIAA